MRESIWGMDGLIHPLKIAKIVHMVWLDDETILALVSKAPALHLLDSFFLCRDS